MWGLCGCSEPGSARRSQRFRQPVTFSSATGTPAPHAPPARGAARPQGFQDLLAASLSRLALAPGPDSAMLIAGQAPPSRGRANGGGEGGDLGRCDARGARHARVRFSATPEVAAPPRSPGEGARTEPGHGPASAHAGSTPYHSDRRELRAAPGGGAAAAGLRFGDDGAQGDCPSRPGSSLGGGAAGGDGRGAGAAARWGATPGSWGAPAVHLDTGAPAGGGGRDEGVSGVAPADPTRPLVAPVVLGADVRVAWDARRAARMPETRRGPCARAREPWSAGQVRASS